MQLAFATKNPTKPENIKSFNTETEQLQQLCIFISKVSEGRKSRKSIDLKVQSLKNTPYRI